MQLLVDLNAYSPVIIQMNARGNFKGELEFRIKCWDSVTSVRGRVQRNGYVGYIDIPQAGSNCILTLSVVSEHGHIWFSKIWYEFMCSPDETPATL